MSPPECVTVVLNHPVCRQLNAVDNLLWVPLIVSELLNLLRIPCRKLVLIRESRLSVKSILP